MYGDMRTPPTAGSSITSLKWQAFFAGAVFGVSPMFLYPDAGPGLCGLSALAGMLPPVLRIWRLDRQTACSITAAGLVAIAMGWHLARPFVQYISGI